jgi:hypothetical protein
MPFLELFDETLDINSTENYELALQVSPDNLTYCLLDTIRNKFVLLRSFEPDENKYLNPEMISGLIDKDDFLTKRFKKVSIIVPSSKFTLVPTALFDPGKKDEYFAFNHTPDEGRSIFTNKINDPDTYLLFSESNQVIALLNSFYPGIHPNHHIKSLFNYIAHCRKSVTGNYIHLHIEREYFNLIIFHSNQLTFCNTYTYRNISDILYFILNVFKKLNINQEETVHLSGLTEKYDDLTSNLSIYIRKLVFSEPSGNFTFSYVFNETNLHRFLNLFNIINCE